jgi:hypothetical protein
VPMLELRSCWRGQARGGGGGVVGVGVGVEAENQEAWPLSWQPAV